MDGKQQWFSWVCMIWSAAVIRFGLGGSTTPWRPANDAVEGGINPFNGTEFSCPLGLSNRNDD
jgi:hypothetical protein